jgi:cyclopropane-fatty-acyl-phospholipid synthase
MEKSMSYPLALIQPKKKLHQRVAELLSHADVEINGRRPWDINVYNDDFYARVIRSGSLGLGETYMEGMWDSPRLDEFIYRILKAKLHNQVHSLVDLFCFLQAKFMNLQSSRRAYEVGEHHYDMDNGLYRRMLDKRMIYSCGFWKHAASLDEAQEAKLEMICRKLVLKPGMRVLDIGCGWGGMAQFAAENYGVEVVGITVSQEQVAVAKERCAGLPVDIRLQDYRNLNERFDRILSIGMFEHVGYKNYRTFMKKVRELLNTDGLFLLHTIGNNISTTHCDPWFDKYIFPNGMLPSVSHISESIEKLFVMEDWHNFGADYDKTLVAWFNNFEKHWPHLKDKYDNRFYRMWKYYLLSFAGAFRARHTQLWQIVLSPEGVAGGYMAHYK